MSCPSNVPGCPGSDSSDFVCHPDDETRAISNATKRMGIIKARVEVIKAAKEMTEAMTTIHGNQAATMIKVARAVDKLKELEEGA